MLDGPRVVSALTRVLDRHHSGSLRLTGGTGVWAHVLFSRVPWEGTRFPAALAAGFRR